LTGPIGERGLTGAPGKPGKDLSAEVAELQGIVATLVDEVQALKFAAKEPVTL
jgi:hypothetical protein